MARRQTSDVIEIAQEASGGAGRRSRTRAEARPDVRRRLRVWFHWTVWVAGVVAAALAIYRLDHFLSTGQPFALTGSVAESNANFRIEGCVYTRRAVVARVFAPDFGRSIYLMPVAQRRRALLRVDWIADASVARIWPNRVVVRITERKPVAFALLPTESGSLQTALVDADGAIMAVPEKAGLKLPALFGIQRELPQSARKERVQLALGLMKEIGSFAGQLSEIDVSDAENLAITAMSGGRAVRLMLGDRNFRTRLSNFLAHFPDIGKRLPGASAFDLRLDDRITALEVNADGQ